MSASQEKINRLVIGPYRQGAHYRYGNPADHRAREVFYEIAQRERPESILDVGCGQGQDSGPLMLLGIRYVGVDPIQRNLAIAKEKNPNADFRLGFVQELPFPDASFDWIWMFGVWEDLPEDTIVEATNECLRVAQKRIYAVDARDNLHLVSERYLAIPLPYEVKIFRVSYDPVKNKNFRMWMINKEKPLLLKPKNPLKWRLDGLPIEDDYKKYL